MNKKELKSNKKFKNKTTTKNCSNLISNHQPLISDHKGITLIALVITIIVMLILVGVTVTVALNGGLFNQAKDASRKTQNEINKEQDLANEKIEVDGNLYASLDDYVNNKPMKWGEDENGNITFEDEDLGLKVGDYVDYTYDTAEAYPLPTTKSGYSSDQTINQTKNLKWKILGVDKNGRLTLISDKPTSGTTVGFGGAKGYNNGVYILNDICAKQYSNKELGITARSLTIEDVEAGFREDTGIAERNKYTNNIVQYGKTKTYTGTTNLQYPVLYAQENDSGVGVTEDKAETDLKKDGIGESVAYYNDSQLIEKPEKTEILTAGDNEGEEKALTCMQTYYKFSSTPADYCKDPDIFYNLIFGTDSYYWLASRFIFPDGGCVRFGFHSVHNTEIGGPSVFSSIGEIGNYTGYLRPVISLGSSFKITNIEETTDSETLHHLSK